MKVLLVSPYMIKDDPRERRELRAFAPLGPLYIAGVLKELGVKTRFYDATYRTDYNDFDDVLGSFKPDAVGIYSTMSSRNGALELAANSAENGATIIAGGPDATTYPEEYMAGKFDIVVFGEGEDTVFELIPALRDESSLDKIDGIVHKKDGKNVHNPPRRRIKELDAIPFPDRSIVDIEQYRERWQKRHGQFNLSMMSSRGCPYRCSFCSRPVFGRNYRPRSVENVVDELKEIRSKYRPDGVKFADDILPTNRKRTLKLCKAITEEKLDLKFECLSRMNLMDNELLTAMKKAGFTRIYYGVESGSQNVLDAMCKGQTVDDIRRVGMQMKKIGIAQHWYMMLGYPGETLADIEQTISLIQEVVPDEFSTTIAHPIRGTQFYSDISETLPEPAWKQSEGTDLVFKNRYSKTFYRWSMVRMYVAHYLARKARSPNSALQRLNSGVSRGISRLLSFGG